MPDRFGSGAAVEQRLRRFGAQQQAGAHGTQQPLVARHGNEIRPPGIQIDFFRSGALGRVHRKGHPIPAAQPAELRLRQHIAEHIGRMGKHRRVHPLLQGILKPGQGIRRVKELPPRHRHPGSQGIQGPYDGIVLEARHQHPAPRLHQAADGNIQAVGAVGSKHHLLRTASKQG